MTACTCGSATNGSANWVVAAVLAVASLLQISLGPGQVHQQALGALFAVATCATVSCARGIRPPRGMTTQGLMALDFLTWHNLAGRRLDDRLVLLAVRPGRLVLALAFRGGRDLRRADRPVAGGAGRRPGQLEQHRDRVRRSAPWP